MINDYELHASTRVCAATGRALRPGEVYFSVLQYEQQEETSNQPLEVMCRRDYAADAWTPPADDLKPTEDSLSTEQATHQASALLGWWRNQIPTDAENQRQLAPADVLLNLFAELAEQPSESKFRYVLGLLLVRKKLLKLVETQEVLTEQGVGEALLLACPSRGEEYQLPVAMPNAAEADSLETRIQDLLYAA